MSDLIFSVKKSLIFLTRLVTISTTATRIFAFDKLFQSGDHILCPARDTVRQQGNLDQVGFFIYFCGHTLMCCFKGRYFLLRQQSRGFYRFNGVFKSRQ